MNQNKLWLERWENRELGFNQSEVNDLMLKFFKNLKLEKGNKVLVPLCGKSIDISWLLDEGYEVIGVELSETAIKELFEALEIVPIVSSVGELTLYSSEKLKVYVGDFFKVSAEMLGDIDAIYDRAALVALTLEWRIKYAKHIREITNRAIQFLISIEYEDTSTSRSPYSVDGDALKQLYSKYYKLNLLSKEKIEGGFKGKFPASDTLWILN